MTDLRTLVEPLKREVAVPGTYDDVFPDTDDDALLGTLADSLAEAQIWGMFGDVTLSPEHQTSRDLSAAGGAIVVLFAGMRILRAQLRTLNQSSTYKAGSVEYSTAAMTSVIRDELSAMRARVDAIVVDSKRSGRAVGFGDGYAGKLTAYAGSLGAFHTYEF